MPGPDKGPIDCDPAENKLIDTVPRGTAAWGGENVSFACCVCLCVADVILNKNCFYNYAPTCHYNWVRTAHDPGTLVRISPGKNQADGTGTVGKGKSKSATGRVRHLGRVREVAKLTVEQWRTNSITELISKPGVGDRADWTMSSFLSKSCCICNVEDEDVIRMVPRRGPRRQNRHADLGSLSDGEGTDGCLLSLFFLLISGSAFGVQTYATAGHAVFHSNQPP